MGKQAKAKAHSQEWLCYCKLVHHRWLLSLDSATRAEVYLSRLLILPSILTDAEKEAILDGNRTKLLKL